MSPNVNKMSIAELWELYEEIKECDEDFETTEKTIKKDIHKWYTGEELEEEVEGMEVVPYENVIQEHKECECLYEFKWRGDGFDALNLNLCCDVCLEVYNNGERSSKW